MPNILIALNTRRPFGLQSKRTNQEALRYLINHLEAVNSGRNQSDALIYAAEETPIGSAPNDNSFAGQAVALLTGSGMSGSVGATIDGTTVTATYATSDANTMGLICAAIRANATVNRKVTAVNRVARITCGTVLAGEKVLVAGAELEAVSGTPKAYGQFDMSSGVAATIATSLALAINRHPALAMRYRAVAASAVVNVGLTDERTPGPREYIESRGANIATTVKTFASGAFGLIIAAVPGPIGNCCTAVASGTGVTLTTANAGKLGSGMGGGTSYNVVVP
jgi:hypothetical protein